MDKPKKKVSLWWVGFIYSLTAGLPAFIVGGIVAAVAGGAFTGTDVLPLWAEDLGIAVTLLVLWPCAKSAARYVRLVYEIDNMIEVVLWGVVFFYSGLQSGMYSADASISDPFVWLSIPLSIGGLIYFYKISKTFLMDVPFEWKPRHQA